MRPEVRAGMKQLERLGLVLDAWVFHPQLGEVVDLARAFPQRQHRHVPHGRPAGLRPVRRQEGRSLRQLEGVDDRARKCPNVSVKLGGVTMRLAAYDYGKLPAPPSSEALAGYWGPYVKTCIDLFGPDRCMVESNYPVEKMGIGMPALWNMFKRLTAGASAAEKKAIFSGTANRVYRLVFHDLPDRRRPAGLMIMSRRDAGGPED
jgi:predicted TIM-barrel fold metal-dependent hydrolase